MTANIRPPEIYTRDEIQALLDACSRRGPTGLRNKALLTLLWRSGLRIKEALDLVPTDLNIREGKIYVRFGKGKNGKPKSRWVGMDHKAFDEVAKWQRKRDELGFGNKETLFCTLKGARLKEAYIRELLPRLGKKAGLSKRVHAHGLRHTLACELATERVSTNDIRQQLGHTNLAVTTRYLENLSPQSVFDTMSKRTW